jgi:hypothetical protein
MGERKCVREREREVREERRSKEAREREWEGERSLNWHQCKCL